MSPPQQRKNMLPQNSNKSIWWKCCSADVGSTARSPILSRCNSQHSKLIHNFTSWCKATYDLTFTSAPAYYRQWCTQLESRWNVIKWNQWPLIYWTVPTQLVPKTGHLGFTSTHKHCTEAIIPLQETSPWSRPNHQWIQTSSAISNILITYVWQQPIQCNGCNWFRKISDATWVGEFRNAGLWWQAWALLGLEGIFLQLNWWRKVLC